MSKDINSKWTFVEMLPNIPSRSGEDSTFDHFRGTTSRFIVREFIQNSMDAATDTTGATPVKVKFESGRIKYSDYPELIGALKERMIACQNACNENEHSRNPYINKVLYLKKIQDKEIPYLVIADYNTTGMEFTENKQCAFNAGVRQMGASHKGTGHAGGSHGMGKTIGFVASELNAVYYSTKTLDESTFGEGVIRLCTHSYKGKNYFADAFYDSKDGIRPDYAKEIPEDFRRSEIGTSVFILGMEPTKDEIFQMKQEVLRSFWLAIWNKRLVVDVYDETFKNTNLKDKMLEYYPDSKFGKYDIKSNRQIVEKFNPRPYFFDCVVNSKDEASHFIFEAKSSKYPSLEHAVLYIFKDETIKNYSEDRIVCMRDKEMVIQFNRPGTRKGYYGVLVCDGDGSKYLRKIENVTHDKWDKTELKELDQETKNNANNVLKEIETFIKESVSAIFPESDDAEYKVPVLSKYIVAAGSRKEQNTKGELTEEILDSSQDPQAAMSTKANGEPNKKRVQPRKVGRVVICRKGGAKKKKSKTIVENGMGLSSQPVEAPVTTPSDAQTSPQPSGSSSDNSSSNEVPTSPVNPVTGKVGHESDKKGSHKSKKGGKHTKDIIANFRVVPIPTDNGLVHRIIINSDDDYRSCSMVISVAGEDTDTTLRFYPINKKYRVVGKDYNILSDFDLIKGKNFIDIKFEDEDYHSLNIKAYEN